MIVDRGLQTLVLLLLIRAGLGTTTHGTERRVRVMASPCIRRPAIVPGFFRGDDRRIFLSGSFSLSSGHPALLLPRGRIDDDDDDTQVTCAPAFVTVDQGNPHYSAFSIDVSVDPGRGRGQPSVEH